MEIPRFNWHLMTSLFTRDNTERRKKKKSRTEKKKKMLRVVRDSLCISLESDTHTHKKRRRKNKRWEKEKNGKLLYLIEGKRELASWAGVCNTADTQRSIYSQNKKM
jgi:hypothetical protein